MKTKSFLPSLLGNRENAIQSFDSIFDKMFESSFPELSNSLGIELFQRGSYPKVNVIDQDKSMVIIAEIAGLNKEDINVNYREGIITISGGKRFDEQKITGTFICKELKHSSFTRSFRIDAESFETDKIDAKFENGLLNINIPKVEPSVSKKELKQISIK